MIEKFHPVTHCIMDMDGLLLNTEPKYEIAINSVCEKYGSKYTHEAKLHCLGRVANDSAKAVIKYCNLPITVDEFQDSIKSEYLKVFQNVDLMPGAEKIVQHLASKNFPQAVATSSQKSTFDLKAKNHQEFFKNFNHIVIGSNDPDVKQGKPSPDIFLVAASRFPNPPTDMKSVLVFEDSIAGVQAALAAGMQVVWIPDPNSNLDITSQEATLILKSMEEFKPELFGIPAY